jgi:methanogenic corrinoid protein MtbC1
MPRADDAAQPADGTARDPRGAAADDRGSEHVTDLHPPPVDDLAEEYLDRFAAGDRHAVVSRTRALLRSGTPARHLRDAVARTQHRVGELWETGRWTVTQEHVATKLAEAAIATIDDAADLGDPSAPPRDRVAVVAADGEWHALAARLSAQALDDRGLGVIELGAALPADDLARSLPALHVDALAISVTLGSNLVGAARSVEAAWDLDIPILLGGRAASEERARRLGATGYAPDAETGAELLHRWLSTTPPTAPAPTCDLTAASGTLRIRQELVAEAYTGVEERWPVLATAPERTIDRIIEDLELLVDHAAAALLVDDDSLLAEQLPWLHGVHLGRGLPGELLDAEVAALHGAVHEDGRLRELFDRVS